MQPNFDDMTTMLGNVMYRVDTKFHVTIYFFLFFVFAIA